MGDKRENQQRAQRHTAMKMPIAAIKKGVFIAKEGWEPHIVQTMGMEIARVNIIGVIVAKQAQDSLFNYGHAVLDDGSDKVVLRSFSDMQIFSHVNIGDVCLVIGRPREYGGEIYVVPEIVRHLDDPAWLSLRALELAQAERQRRRVENLKASASDSALLSSPQKESIVDNAMPKTPHPAGRQRKSDAAGPVTARIFGEVDVLRILRRLDEGFGVQVDKLIDACQDESAEEIIHLLLQKGDVFEVRPGTIKILE